MPTDLSLLGFSTVVAPINQTKVPWDKMPENLPPVRSFPKLLGGRNASAPVAPSLCSVIRKKLELQKMQPPNIALYLARLKNLGRYDRAFKKLW